MRVRVIALLLAAQGALSAQAFLDWHEAAPLPEPLGVAGPFVGVAGGKLLVAGGAHFPVSPFQGGAKVWLDRVYALDPQTNQWSALQSLPRPLAYGVSITLPESAATPRGAVVLIGGSDAQRHYADVYRLGPSGAILEGDPLPPLPQPLANASGALLDGVLYVVGGQSAPDSTAASSDCLALDLAASDPQWRALERWPGPGRIFPVVAAQEGALFAFSGAELIPDGQGGVTRRFLTDGYRYRPGRGWDRVADTPHPMVAAPALAWGNSHVLVFGGDDGSKFFHNEQLGDDHPGFPRGVWDYHTVTDTWTQRGEAPFGRVTTTAVQWRGQAVVAAGEDRPGHRSPQVFHGRPIAQPAHFRSIDYAVLVVYLAALVAMGFYFSKRESTTDDFFLAGRRIPWWAAGLSIYGTQLSSISYIAMPAKVFATDWVYLLVQASIVLIAIPVVFIYLPFFRRIKLTSAYEYLELRFSLPVRLFASASFILYQIGRMAIVLFLPAIALSTVTGIGVYACILVMGALATLYTALGGIEAVVWTDVVQVFVLLAGALLSLLVILGQLDGGLAGLISSGAAAGKFHTFDWTWDYTTTAVWVVLIGNLFNNLVPYTSDQAVIQRYLTTKDENAAARGIWVNALIVIPSTLILFLLGTSLWAFYRAHPVLLSPGQPADSVFPLFIAQQLPAGIAGLVIAGVFAASMSTLDSSLNSIATALTTDWYARFKPLVADASKLSLARWLTVLLGVLATASSLALATFEVGSLWDAFQAGMGLFGGGLAGLFALGIMTTRANGRGALVGAIASVFVLAWVQQSTPLHFFLYGMVGVGSCFAIGYAASLVLPDSRRDLAGLTLYTKAR